MTTIRKADMREIAWINECYDEVGFVHSDYQREFIAIAEVDGERAGIGRLVTVNSGAFELGGIYVFDPYRGKGVAAKIVDFLTENAEVGRAIFCLPFAHLAGFYQQHGFRKCNKDEVDEVPEEVRKKHQWCNSKYPNETLLFIHSGKVANHSHLLVCPL